MALVVPITCDICNRSLYHFEQHICRICEASLPVTSYHLRPDDNDLKQKLTGLTEVRNVISFLRFSKRGKSQKILHQLKYNKKPELGVKLGMMYGDILSAHGYVGMWDIIVPVPLHKRKEKRRGYNQSRCFAEGIGIALNTSVGDLLQRSVNTSTQTQKSRWERWENVAEVFSYISTEDLTGKNVLLVDDVLTTGATLSSCANELLKQNPKSLDIAIIAAGSTI